MAKLPTAAELRAEAEEAPRRAETMNELTALWITLVHRLVKSEPRLLVTGDATASLNRVLGLLVCGRMPEAGA